MLSMVKMLLKGEIGGRALNIHGNYIVDHGKSWKNHGIVFLNFCWTLVLCPDEVCERANSINSETAPSDLGLHKLLLSEYLGK